MKTTSQPLLAVIAILILASCRYTNRDGSVKFNNELMLIDQRVQVSAGDIADSLVVFDKTRVYTGIKDMRLELVDYIERSITQIERLQIAGIGCKQFRDEEIVFLRLVQNKYDVGLRFFENLTPSSSDSDLSAAYDTFNGFNDEISKSIERVGELQFQYAKDNGFKLEKRDLINEPFKKPAQLPPPLIRM